MNKKQMLESVRNYLSSFGDVDDRILKAMKKIDRKDFMDTNKEFAHVDNAMPIGYGQTISQPSTVARMLQLLQLKCRDKVLEIGTGSGWNAFLISYLVKPGQVKSLEIVGELAEKSKERIRKLGIKNIEIEEKDFRKLNEKFDKIIFTAGILQEQENIIRDYANKHLRDGGILVCPRQSGRLMIFKKMGGVVKESWTDEEYVFVPLVL